MRSDRQTPRDSGLHRLQCHPKLSGPEVLDNEFSGTEALVGPWAWPGRTGDFGSISRNPGMAGAEKVHGATGLGSPDP